jgi:hypothetical protein
MNIALSHCFQAFSQKYLKKKIIIKKERDPILSFQKEIILHSRHTSNLNVKCIILVWGNFNKNHELSVSKGYILQVIAFCSESILYNTKYCRDLFSSINLKIVKIIPSLLDAYKN